MNPKTIAVFVLLAFLSGITVALDESRDFYTEPGLNRFQTGMGQDLTENINNFNGHLQLSYTDLLVPGNGGLDIVVRRFYNMPQGMAGYDDVAGLGWTMHYGRITVPSGFAASICSLAAGTYTNNNPSFEFPSGGREQFYVSSALAGSALVTKSNWKAECINPNDYRAGVQVTAPDGTEYQMDVYMHLQGEASGPDSAAPYVETWYPSRIEDVRGNFLEFSYGTIGDVSLNAGLKYLTDIVASDGRHVYYEYIDENNAPVNMSSLSARISAVRANGQVVRYEYQRIDEAMTGWGGLSRYQLTAAIRPDDARWAYEYYSDPLDLNNHLALKNITYPTGGIIGYQYQRYRPYPPNATFQIRAIRKKQQFESSGAVKAEWVYSFSPGGYIYPNLDGVNDLPVDVVNIDTPEGREKFYYIGYQTVANKYDVLFQIGLEVMQQIYDVSGSLWLEINKGWTHKREVSNQIYKNGILSALFDTAVWDAHLATEVRWTTSEVVGAGYITRVDYNDYDEWGYLLTKTYLSPLANTPDLISDSTYSHNTSDWIVGLETRRQLTWSDPTADYSKVINTFNDYGELIARDNDGVVTAYEYDSQGNLYRETDARSNTTTYLDYYRGIPRLEQYSDGTSSRRVVNPTGTIAEITSPRGNTKRFQYDGMNRLVAIDFPLGHDVTIAWSPNSRVLVRGDYKEETIWNEYGWQSVLTRGDLSTENFYLKNFSYDVFGRKIFESDFNSADGVSWVYDRIGRTIRNEFQDGSAIRYIYKGPFEVDKYDENNQITTMGYMVFGHPEDFKRPYWQRDSDGVTTIFDHDIIGNLTEVFRGELDESMGFYQGYSRYFRRDTRHFLVREQNPGLIDVHYGRDEVGNMISLKVGNSEYTYYEYDAKNRISRINYPGFTPDVEYEYDADGNVVSIINENASRDYSYDENGNLIEELVTIEGIPYSIGYQINGYDHVASVTYPSGRVIAYTPDAFGRPTQIGPYVSDILYADSGSISGYTQGNGLTTVYQYTPRHWVDLLQVSGASGSVVSLDYAFFPNGNVEAIADLQDPAESRAMTYDALGRLISVNGGWGQSVFGYDIYGNLSAKSTPGGLFSAQSYEYSGMLLDRLRFDGSGYQRYFEYDSMDNIRESWTYGSGGYPEHSIFVFNYAGNLIKATRDLYTPLESGEYDHFKSGNFSAMYDGDDNRVVKTDYFNGEKKTHYVYNKRGEFYGEYLSNGPEYGHEYLYLNQKLVASVKTPAPKLALAGDDFVTCAGQPTVLSGGYTDAEMQVESVMWEQTAGPAVLIGSADQFSASFVPVLSALDQDYAFRFVIAEIGGGTIEDSLTVTALADCPPVADAGLDFYALGGGHFWLDGTASIDYQGPLGFAWDSTDFDILTPDAAWAKAFAIDAPASYSGKVTLSVADQNGNVATDSVTVTVLPRAPDDDSDGLPDNWEWIYFGSITSYAEGDDPDGDGFTNAEELAGETDPTKVNPPPAVAKVVVLPGDGRSTVLWEKAARAAGYELYWTTDPSQPISSWTKVAAQYHYYDHVGLVNGQTYHYAVRAHNENGAGDLSAIVNGVPRVRDWTGQMQGLPEGVSLPSGATVVTTNRFGDTLVVYQEAVDELWQLVAWRYSVLSGWSGPEVISESSAQFEQLKGAIDISGNALVAWLRKTGTRDDLWASRYAEGAGWGAEQLLEHYNGDALYNVSGTVEEISGVQFAETGDAVICWRQNELHFLNGRGNSAARGAFARFIGADGSLEPIVRLERTDNIGFTDQLSCAFDSSGSNFVAIWGRSANYDPPGVLYVDDVMYRVWSSSAGWSTPGLLDTEFGEILGSPDENVFDMPVIAIDAPRGKAVAVWRGGE